MKKILLFGAGKSATVLIDFLLKNLGKEDWQLTAVDSEPGLAQSKTGDSSMATGLCFDVNDSFERRNSIAGADIVICLLPPALQPIVSRDCVELKKNFLTANYVDDSIRSLKQEIHGKNLLFLCEMGLDPGLDHMCALKMIDKIHNSGGRIISFHSHCGGLVSPECDDNPWRYKISWNPKGIALAGKAGANYKENGVDKRLKYEELFSPDRMVEIPGLGNLCWYPNRDSLEYIPLYRLEEAGTFIRSTLRYPDFMYGWKNIIDLNLTDETPRYETNGKTLSQVFKEHMDRNGFGEWLENKLSDRFSQTKEMLDDLVKLMEAEKEVKAENLEVPREFLTVDEKGNITEIELDEIKNRAAGFLAHRIHEANLTLKQLFFLGLDDKETMVNKGFCSPANILEFAIEKKLALGEKDRDMIVMMNEIQYEIISEDRAPESRKVKNTLIVKGEDNLRTAMAKTVGLPLGIATRLILNGNIQLKGLRLPVEKEIYEPVLKELENYGIRFIETAR